MRIKVFVYLVLIVFVSINTTLADKITINTKEKNVLKEKKVTFSDIALVTGDNVELVNLINNLELGRTPWPNSIRRIDVDFMRMRLGSLGIRPKDVIFKGPRIVTVSVESSKISGPEIAKKAREYLLSTLPMDDRESTIELLRMPEDKWVSRKKDEIVLDAYLVDSGKDRGNVGVMVNVVSTDGTSSFRIPVFFKVRVFEYVVIAKKKISRQQPLSGENVFIGRRETTKSSGLAFSRIKDIVGKTAVRNIIPNTIITENIVETPPTVLKGDLVKLYIKTNGFSMVTKGLAQETGYIGSIIKVKSVDSKKLIYGRIIDSQNIQIVF